MRKLDICYDFKRLIPPISKEEYDLLRKSILKDGCRDAIVVWTETLTSGEQGDTMILDGHNRYEICKKNKIEPQIIELKLKNKDEAKIWVIQNQLGRRNLTSYQRGKLTLELKTKIQEKAKEKQKGGGKEKVVQKSAEPPIKVRDELAKIAGVSHDTIHKIEVIEKEGTPEIKESAEKGDISINKAYKVTRSPAPQKESKEESDSLFQLKRWWKKATGRDKRGLFMWIIQRQETPKGFLLDIIHSENPEFQKIMKEDQKKRRAWREGNYSGLKEAEPT